MEKKNNMKAKFKINQLAAKPVDVELVHPTIGATGIFVQMCGPHSAKLKTAFEAYYKLENPTETDQIKLFVASLMGWDEEAFEQPFSPEAALAFFSQPENSWISEQLAPVMVDKTKFFRVEGRKAS
jgi:hypothetical protein